MSSGVWMCTDSWAKLKPFKVEATAHIMYKYLKSWDRGAAEVREWEGIAGETGSGSALMSCSRVEISS